MRYYKDAQNKTHALESSDFEHLLPTGCVEITEQEHAKLTAPADIDPRENMTISAAQARVNLNKAGLRLVVEDAIAKLPLDNDMRTMWEFATILHRLNPTLNEFCAKTLKLSPEKIDALFTL